MNGEKIYDSGPAMPDDGLWLEQGKKLVEGSFDAVAGGAKSLMTGIGVLQGVYLAILGFSGFMPAETGPWGKIIVLVLAIAPLVLWLAALYNCLRVLKTDPYQVRLTSPENIRENMAAMLTAKQQAVDRAFYWLTGGLAVVLVLIILRLIAM